MSTTEPVSDEIKVAVQALINEANTHLAVADERHSPALAMAILDYFAAHVIISVAHLSERMTVADVASMHCKHSREISKRLAERYNLGK